MVLCITATHTHTLTHLIHPLLSVLLASHNHAHTRRTRILSHSHVHLLARARTNYHTQPNICTRTHMRLQTHAFARAHTCAYTFTLVIAYTFACIFMPAHTCTRAYSHTHIYLSTDLFMHAPVDPVEMFKPQASVTLLRSLECPPQFSLYRWQHRLVVVCLSMEKKKRRTEIFH